MKLMKFFLTGALALSTIAPSLSGMEAINRYLNSAPQEQPATAQEIENAQECSICQDNFVDDPAIRTLRCNLAGVPHIFHRQCINNWLISRQAAGHASVCPICQNPTVPAMSRKEQLVAKAKPLEHLLNPFNQNNRKATACAVSLHAIAALTVILGKSLIAKYYFPNSYKEILHDTISTYFCIGKDKDKFLINGFNALDFLNTYWLLKQMPELQFGRIQDIIANKGTWLTLVALKLFTQLAFAAKFADSQAK